MPEQSLAVTLALQNIRGQVATGKGAVKPPKMPQTWRYPQGQEEDYYRLIGRTLAPFFAIVDDWLLLYPSWVRTDGLHADGFAADWDKAMKALREHQRKVFEQGDGRELYALVSGIGDATAQFNFKQWSKYLSAIAGQPYFPAESSWVAESVETWSDLNFELIRSLTDDYIKKVNTTVVSAVNEGTTYADLTKKIQSVNKNMSKARARLLARDQIGKLNGQLAGRRQTDAGVEEYTWKGAMDERERDSHRALQGKICEWKDATKVKVGKAWQDRSSGMVKLAPGMDIQCRCYGSPNMDAIWQEAEDIAVAEGWYKTGKGGR